MSVAVWVSERGVALDIITAGASGSFEKACFERYIAWILLLCMYERLQAPADSLHLAILSNDQSRSISVIPSRGSTM